MLQNIRNNIQGTMSKVIIALISIPFILTGAETLLSGSSSPTVAKVNGQKIDDQQLKQEIVLLQRRLMAQMGDKLDSSMLEENKLKKPALDALVEQIILQQAAQEGGMTVAESQLNQLIIDTPEFHDESGHFSKPLYDSVLANAGLNSALYKELYRSDILRGQFASGVSNTNFLTEKELEAQAKLLYQTRDIRYLVLPLVGFEHNVKPTSEQVNQYYQAHSAEFTSQEKVVVNYIELNQKDFELAITEADLKQAYDNEVANFKGGEKRFVSHIMLNFANADEKAKDEKELLDIKAQLSKGANFADLAKKYSEDMGSKEQGGELGELQADAFPAEFVAAGNALKAGEVSDVVETSAGLHLIRLDRVAKIEPPSFAERRNALEKELKEAKAKPLYWAALEKLKDISFNAADLEQPSKTLQLTVKQSPAFTRQGGQGLFADSRVYQAAYSNEVLNDNYNSKVIELSDGHAVVLHLKEHDKAALLPLEKVHDQVVHLVKKQQALAQLAEKAKTLQAQIEKGQSLEQLAVKNKFEWQILPATTRYKTGSAAQIVQYAFTLPAVDDAHKIIGSTTLDNGDLAVVEVSNIAPADIAKLSAMEKQALKQFILQSTSMQTFALLQAELKKQAEVKYY